MNKNDILKQIEEAIGNLSVDIVKKNVGKITYVGDGIISCSGLSEVMSGEVVQINAKKKTVKGLAFNLGFDTVGIVVMGDTQGIDADDEVETTGQILSIGASSDLIGRVINPLGESIDGKGEIKVDKQMMIERIASGVMSRESVKVPLQTGIIAIDALTAIGRGQRQLILGDRSTGKTAIAIDSIINQKNILPGTKQVKCIYVSIGQKASKIANIVSVLKDKEAMDYTIVVAANASDPAVMQFIAPYAGVAIAEYFLEKGEDVLIVYDDLSKHAQAYRQIALLLRRPPGREAYPGDVFYLHSRLLERAAKLNSKYGGGSITALPIIETQSNDVSAYIPTNVISITDGQIYLESDLFKASVRPAMNVGISVSRVGGAAQLKGIKKLAGKLKLELAQYRELAAFAQFGSDLDADTLARLKRGKILTELLKQGQYDPIPVEQQMCLLYAATNGYLNEIDTEKIAAWNIKFRTHLKDLHATFLNELLNKKEMSEELDTKLKDILAKFVFE